MKTIYMMACLLAGMTTYAQGVKYKNWEQVLAKGIQSEQNNTLEQVPAKGIQFEQHKTWEQILAQAKKEHKNVFVNCYMQGGKPCIEMDQHVFPVKAVGDYYNSHYVSFAINMEQLPVDENTCAVKATADTLRKRYGVNGYPNLLFLDATGKLLHRFMGSTTPEELITQGKNALDPNKQFYTQLQAYKAGKRDTANMRQLAIDAFNYSESKLAHNITNDYLQGKTDQQLANPNDIALIAIVLQDHERVALLNKRYLQSLSTSQKLQPENIRFIVQDRDQPDTIAYYMDLFLQRTPDSVLLKNSCINILAQVAYQQGSNSKSYQYLWLHRSAVDSVLNTPQSLTKLFSSHISKEIIAPFMKQAGDTPDWDSLQQAITAKYSSDYADHSVILTKFSWYVNRKEWPVCMQLIVELDKKYGAKRSAYEVNSELGTPVLNRSNDPVILQYALGRMQQVIDTQSPTISEVTTYAKLLYNTGRKADAVRWEKIALEAEPDNKDISTILEQMNNDTLITLKP
jgi:thioredoxin-related protein